MRTQSPPILRFAPILTAMLLCASAAAPRPASGQGQDTVALRIEHQRQELQKLRVETGKLQAETEKTRVETEKTRADTKKTQAETANLENWVLRYLPVFTALGALAGALIGLFKYFKDRAQARRAEITESVKTLLPLLGGSDASARVTAASTLGVIATAHGGELPELPRQVVAALFGQMAQPNIAASEQTTFASVVSALHAGHTNLLAAPPEGTNLSGVSFDRLVLRNLHLEGTALANASFRRATLDAVTLQGLAAPAAVSEGCIVKNASFTGCTLSGVSFDGATVTRLTFSNCKLPRAETERIRRAPWLLWSSVPPCDTAVYLPIQ